MACKKKNAHRYQATETCRNLSLSSNILHPQDRIYLFYDTRLLLRQRIDSLDVKDFDYAFCNHYRKEGVIRLVIKQLKVVIIDTNIRVPQPKYGYHIAVDRTIGQVTLAADTSVKM